LEFVIVPIVGHHVEILDGHFMSVERQRHAERVRRSAAPRQEHWVVSWQHAPNGATKGSRRSPTAVTDRLSSRAAT
jgi:hypothetical protein